MLKLGPTGGKHFFTDLDMVIHRPAHIKEQQDFNRVMAFRDHLDIQKALMGCRFNGVIHIKQGLRPRTGKFTQAAQGHLDVTGP